MGTNINIEASTICQPTLEDHGLVMYIPFRGWNGTVCRRT